MHIIDWLVLIGVLLMIILYGIYKSKTTKNLEGYFLSNRSLPWFLVLMSIMGTQASAVTFLSGPGQAYSDGMRFVQYYFGLPIAMIVISYWFVPVYSRLKVITAYEFLEKRFNLKTRTFTAFLFLLSRGLSTGISIFAPSIILSSLMGWNIYVTNLLMGGVLIVYTLTGGAKAVAYTQVLQMIIVFISLFLVGWIAVSLLPGDIGFSQALEKAGDLGKMNVITTGFDEQGNFDWKDKYNLWSGIIGGFFLALSYFGTDHSQVGRYLTAKDKRESKKGLLMNGVVKIPMQFFILLIGVLIFLYYHYSKPPVFFDGKRVELAMKTDYAPQLAELDKEYQILFDGGDYDGAMQKREEYKNVLKAALPTYDANDNNYIFLYFVKQHLPKGLIGLLFAVIFLAAWGSIAAALNSLAACSMVDFHKVFINKNMTQQEDYNASRWYTLFWGLFCIVVAMFANNIGNSLIEAVNILGSIFYGVILGVFLVAFWCKYIKGNAVFIAAVISQILVILIYRLDVISFLWLNVIGAVLVVSLGFMVEWILRMRRGVAG